jgi:hypothetical protein
LLLAPLTAPPLLAALRLALLPLSPPAVAGLAGTDALLGALLLLLLLLLLVAPLLLLLLLSSQASSCAAYLPASKQALLAILLHSCSSFRQASGAPAAERWPVAAADAPASICTCVVHMHMCGQPAQHS